jgi:Skp family chaperone for outer membrane proteins
METSVDQDLNPTSIEQNASTVEAPVTPESSTPAFDNSAYIAQLEAAYNASQSELQRFNQYREDLEWMAADETRREAARRFRESYDTASKPQIHPELAPIVETFQREIQPLKEYVTAQQREYNDRQRQETLRFQQENIQYAQRLQAQEKLSSDDIVQLGAFADALASRYRRNVGIEEAWKTMTKRRDSGESSRPAPSLRADAGAIGVPGPSTNKTDRYKSDFHGALVDSIKAARKTG